MNREDEQINDDVFGSNDPIHALNNDELGDTPLTNSENDESTSEDDPSSEYASEDTDESTSEDGPSSEYALEDTDESTSEDDPSSEYALGDTDESTSEDDPSSEYALGDTDESTTDPSPTTVEESTDDQWSLFDDALMAASFSNNDDDDDDAPADDVTAFDDPVVDTTPLSAENDDNLDSNDDTSPAHPSFMDDAPDFDVDDTLFDAPNFADTPSVQVSSLEFDSPSPMVGTNPAYGKNLFKNIKVDVSIELGRATISLKNLYELKKGSIIELSRLVGEPLDLLINDQVIAHGEVAVVDNHYAVRITKMNELDTIQ